MQRTILWLGTALLSLPALAQNPCDSLTAGFQWGSNGGDPNGIFYSANSGQATAYFWTFGDGDYAFTPQGVHTYPGPGTYELCLTVVAFDFGTFDTCSTTHCEQVTIVDSIPCNAEFAHYFINNNEDSVHFYPMQPGATSYLWNFGDGSSSTQQYPWHVYTQPGTYYPCLTVTVPGGYCTWCDTVSVGEPPCNAEFAHYFINNNEDSVHFYPMQQNATSYLWNFGDGSSSSQQYPWHVYTQPGTYYPCLTVTVNGGSCTRCDTVSVGEPPCNAEFGHYSINNNEDSVHFYPMQQGATAYVWTFGDGTSSIQPSPWHLYPGPGTYYPCLTVTIDSTSCMWCDTVIIADGPPCNAEFVHYPINNDPANIHFFPLGQGATSYLWNFGDGSSSDLLNPSHVYGGPGTYYPCLTVTVNGGSCTWCDTVFVAGGGSPCDQINADFSTSTQGLNAYFYNVLSSNDYTYSWNFGDGTTGYGSDPSHTYAAPGSYYACLTMWAWNDQTQDTCFADHCEWVTVEQGQGSPCDSLMACFNYTGQNNLVAFSNCSFPGNMDVNYHWQFGDGTVSDAENPVHTYPLPGEYYVCLTVSFNNGLDSCHNTACQWVNTINGSPCDNAQLSFNAQQQGGGVVVFTGSATPAANNYQWFFGDGSNTTGGLTAQHWYSSPGVYNACLVAWYWNDMTQDSCAVEYCHEISVMDGTPCDSISACFQWGTQNNMTTFYNCSWGGGQDLIYHWTFGDGSVSDAENPMHTYPQPGTYNVCLTIWFANTPDSCASTICNNVVIGGGGSPCDNAQLSFTSASQGNNGMLFSGSANPPAGGYQWIFGDGATEMGGLIADHQYAQPGEYYACLVAWYWDQGTQDTCWTEHCQWIIVPGGNNPCDSLNACFQWTTQNNLAAFSNCSSGNGQDLIYHWSFGDGSFSDGENPTHTYPQPGTYNVCLTVWYANSPDSCEDTVCNWLTIGGGSPCDALNAEFGVSSTELLAAFMPAQNPPGTTYSWSFGDGTYSNDQSPSHTYAGIGIYHVCLIVGNYNQMTQDSCFEDHCEYVTISMGGGSPCDSLLHASFEWTAGDAIVGYFYNTSQTGLNDVQVSWSFGDNTPWGYGDQIVHTFPESGWYYVCMHISGWIPGTQDSCSAEVCDTVFVGISGIEDQSAGSDLITWPQPFDNVLTVEHHDLQGDVRYVLTDVTGRIVISGHQQVTSRMTLELGALPPGNYQLQVQNDRMNAVVRVMKR